MKNLLYVKLSKRKIPLVYIGILVFTCILYRNIFITYAYTDVYEFVLNASNSNFIDVFIQQGRILYGFFNKILFTNFNSIEYIKFIRLISLLGGILYLFCLTKVLLKYNFPFIFSLLVVLLFATTPSFNIIILWSATYQVSWGMLLSLLAGYIALEHRHSIAYFLLSIVLGLVALNLYQPSYTMFIIPSFLFWIKEGEINGFLRPLAIHATTYIFYFILYKFYLSVFDLLPVGRGGIEYNLFYGFLWFIKGPFEQALSYNFIFAPKFWLNLTRIVLLLIITMASFKIVKDNFGKTIKTNLFRFLITGVFFVLSMLPNILSADKWISYRTMNTLCLLIVIQLTIILSNKPFNSNKYYLPIFTFFFLSVSFLTANFNINNGFISIQEKEMRSVASALSAHVGDIQKNIFYIQPDIKILVKNDIIERVVTDEFGRLSSSSDWVPKSMIKLLLPENSGRIRPYVDQIQEKNYALIDIGKEYLRVIDND